MTDLSVRDVVGVDLSLSGTGIARADGSLVTLKSTPCPDTVADRVDRIVDLADRILALIAPPAVVVIEGPSYGSTGGSEHLRGGLWWWLVGTLRLNGTTVIEVPPASLKKFATGKGNATKPDMRMALFQRAEIDCRDDNQVDAWWLRQIGLHITGGEPRLHLPQTHRDALAKIKIPLEAVGP